MTLEEWGAVKNELRETIGAHNFTSWIEPLDLREVTDGVAIFDVPTSFQGNYVSQNFGDKILYKVSQVNSDIKRLEFSVPTVRRVHKGAVRPVNAPIKNGGTAAANSSAKPGATRPDARPTRPTFRNGGGDGQFPAAPLDERFTFDRFVVGKPNELAHAAARRVAEGGPVTFNPLFFYGGVGLGKTHLMHAIAWELQTARPDLNVLYLSAEQFMYRFVQALRDKKMMDFKEMFRSVDVLMVDDVQFIAGKDSTQEEFFHTFNALMDQNKQIVISADRAPGEIEDLEDRIKSRLQCGLVVDLHPTDYELRLGILQSKVDRYKADYPDLQMDDDVLDFLAQRISTNVRVLEGALTRLYAFASLVGTEITPEMAQDCLSDILRTFERKISIEEIQRQVSDHYNIRLADMIGPKRVRSFARPRQVAMYLCKQMTRRSLPEIGRRFGGRDHTTVMHGVKRIEELRHSDAQIAEDLEMLRRSLEG
ncbi:MAG: chromosomal replication initiator protein DnaA [Pseudomonadota bacterium]